MIRNGDLIMFWKRFISVVMIVTMAATVLCSCAKKDGNHIPHRFASAEEGRELMLSNNENYYDNFSQNDLDFKMQKTGATMDEYKEYAGQQVQEFSFFEKNYINSCIKDMEKTLDKNGYVLPEIDEIVFIKTTMNEELGASGYTHGTQIYLDGTIISFNTFAHVIPGFDEYFRHLLWHELFHCLTRSNPDFRADMYSLVHFTVVDSDYEIPASVFEYKITNPDVEHHNSYATFIIDGEEVDCFTEYITTMHYEEAQASFMTCSTTALVPVDGRDIFYTPEQASNFDEIFGTNTGYVTDPEECMADNFADTMMYGINGKDKQGYPNPEIIQGIIDRLSK